MTYIVDHILGFHFEKRLYETLASQNHPLNFLILEKRVGDRRGEKIQVAERTPLSS